MSRLATPRIAAIALVIATPAAAGVDPLGQYRNDVRIAVPTFHSIAPRIGLGYASSTGNGLVGVGWSLDASSSIARISATQGPPRMDATDQFVLDGEVLVPCAAGTASPSCTSAVSAFGSSTGFYSTRIESFDRIRKDTGWTLWSHNGTTLSYQSSDNGRTYQLTTVTDVHGNHVDYAYVCAAACVIDKVTYAATATARGAEIRFYRETRPDPVPVPGGLLSERLRTIGVSMDGKLVRAFALGYTTAAVNGASMLSTLQQYGNDVSVDGIGTITVPANATVLPAMTMTAPAMTLHVTSNVSSIPTGNLAAVASPTSYASRFPGTTVRNITGYRIDGGDPIPLPSGWLVGDFDGDGRADWLNWGVGTGCSSLTFDTILETHTGAQASATSSVPIARPVNPKICPAPQVWLADLDGDRRDDLIVQSGTHVYSLISQGNGTFAASAVTMNLGGPTCTVADFDGDGRTDIACLSGTSLIVNRPQSDGTWATSTTALPAMTNPQIVSGDFNADGLADIVIASHASTSSWTLWEGASLGDGTFVVLTETAPWGNGVAQEVDRVQMTDFDGDGKADLVLVRSLSLGADVVDIALATKGTLQQRFVFPSPPSPTPSWQERVSFGDFDGDGKADMLLGATQVWAHGRGDGTFDPPPTATAMPGCGTTALPIAADLNGDGRADILCVFDDETVPQYTLSDRMSAATTADVHHWMSGDVSGDGVPDLVYVHHQNPGYQITVILAGTTTPVTRSFVPTSLLALDEPDAGRFMLADVGGPSGVPDGKADLVLISKVAGTLEVVTYLSNGDGTFTEVADHPWKNGGGTVVGYGAIDVQNWRPADLDGNGTTDFVHMYKSSTGVFVEYLLSNGNGTYTNGGGNYFATGAYQYTTPDVQDFLIADVDGDGLSDLVHVEAAPLPSNGGTIRTLINNGNGTFSERAFPTTFVFFRDMRRVRIADLNGDGRADVVHVGTTIYTTIQNGNVTATNQPYLAVSAYFSDGYGGWTHNEASIADFATASGAQNLFEDAAFVRFMDVDGDGRDDIVHLSTGYAGTTPLTLLTIATNPWPTGTSWAWSHSITALGNVGGGYDYEPWKWQRAMDPATGSASLVDIMPSNGLEIVLLRPSDKLSRITTGTGASALVEYTALIGHRDYLPLGAVPAVVSAVTASDDAYSPSVMERVTYDFEQARYSTALRRMLGFAYRSVKDHASVAVMSSTLDDQCGARPALSLTEDLTGHVMAYDSELYVATGAAPPYTCKPYDDVHYDCDGGTCRKMIETTSSYDVYGNTTAVTEVPGGAFSKLVSTVIAAPNLAAYIVDHPATVTTSQYDGTRWNTVAYRTYSYDTATAPGTVGARGDVTTASAWDGNTMQPTTMTYDPTGMLTLMIAPGGFSTATGYDAAYDLYPTSTCASWLCIDHVIDPSTGLETSSIDSNGQTTYHHYDPLGRLVRVDRPDSSFTTTSFTMVGNHMVVHDAISDGSAGDGVSWSERWLDGLGRTYHTVREDGASQDVRFTNASSRADAVSTPYPSGASPAGWTAMQYDALGRVTTRTAPDGSQRRMIYAPGQLTTYNELGVPRVAFSDGRGQITRIDESNLGVIASTYYLYDASGHATRIIDAAGNATTYAFDGFGRLTQTTSPDRGTTTTRYLANGQVDTVTDTLGNKTQFHYDTANRVIKQDDIDFANVTQRTVTMLWDLDDTGALAGDSIGRLVSVTDHQASADLSEAYVYDVMGRTTSSERCTNGTCMTMQQTFDPAGRVATLTYPDQQVVTYSYDSSGHQSGLSGYATASYDVDDHIASLSYANGVVTTNTFDPLREWRLSTNVTAPFHLGRLTVPRSIYSMSYGHDLVGRITTLDITNGSTVHLGYTYDDLGRLTTVVSDPIHSEAFTYDPLGRMTTSAYNGTYHYDDVAHPHAPTRTDSGDMRNYDPIGNLRVLRDASGRALDLTWTVDGHVASVNNLGSQTLTSFVYDRHGDRVAKIGTTSDLYFGPYVEQNNNKLIKYYLLGGKLVARDDGTSVSYYTRDHAGSTRLMTDAFANITNRYDYTAFGRSITKLENVPQDLEFATGRHDDESGLTYMGARYYDDELVHFVSADTLVPDLFDPQSFHRYSYTQQDPIDFADPSGHMSLQVEWKKNLDQQSMVLDLSMSSCGAIDMSCDILNGYLNSTALGRRDGFLDTELTFLAGTNQLIAMHNSQILAAQALQFLEGAIRNQQRTTTADSPKPDDPADPPDGFDDSTLLASNGKTTAGVKSASPIQKTLDTIGRCGFNADCIIEALKKDDLTFSIGPVDIDTEDGKATQVTATVEGPGVKASVSVNDQAQTTVKVEAEAKGTVETPAGKVEDKLELDGDATLTALPDPNTHQAFQIDGGIRLRNTLDVFGQKFQSTLLDIRITVQGWFRTQPEIDQHNTFAPEDQADHDGNH